MFVLVVEDDFQLNEMLKNVLLKEGYDVETAFSGTEALLLLENRMIDLVVLDLMLPGVSGEKVLDKIKEKMDIPIIILSAKSEIDSKVDLIKRGADDYITKPFDNKELLVRIEAVMRRSEPSKMRKKYGYKDIVLDTSSYSVKVAGVEVSFTKYEYLILKLLMSEPGRIFTKNNIYESIWNEEFFGEENAINVHISNIRKKLSEINKNEQYIETVRGIGFRLWRI
ncbi:MAG: response regulator transcription factor [Mediterraneibacter gnavus]